MTKVLMLLDNPLVSDARVEKEAKTLVQAGYSLTIIGTNENNSLSKRESRDGYLIIRILDVLFKSPFRKGYKLAMEKMKNEICQYDFNILHCHDHHMLLLGSMIKSEKPEIKLVYDAHEWTEGYPVYKEVQNDLLTKLKSYVVWKKAIKDELKVLKNVDYFITITPAFQNVYKEKYGLTSPSIALGNVPEKIQYDKNEKYYHQLLGLKETDKILLYYGTIYHSDEQLTELFNTIKKFEELKLLFVGNRDRFYKVQKLVDQDAVLKKFIFFHDKMEANKMNSADIGLTHILTHFEGHRLGFTNKFLQYGMAGLPVISTRQLTCVHYGELYGNAAFYDPESIKSFEDALTEMFQNIDQYKSNAKKLSQEVSWKNESGKLISLYKKIEENCTH